MSWQYASFLSTQKVSIISQLVEAFSQRTLAVGRITPQGVSMLGTGFVIRADGYLATTHHVIGNQTDNLAIIMPRSGSADSYQDLSDNQVQLAAVKAVEIDPIRDIAILKGDFQLNGSPPQLRNFDASSISTPVAIFGFPHCTYGRRAFTYQVTEIGAKVLMSSDGVSSKHAVINVQARPGQSGSPVVEPHTGVVLGMLVGAWVPGSPGLVIGDINPHELHQTTHCISAQHITEMM